ncbi:hypothetical protein JW921_06595, partial [Candidatus Fermentibacterales bacterium]|nr:hypothetical protein [Candidatus Fermentibacterales bacterium]
GRLAELQRRLSERRPESGGQPGKPRPGFVEDFETSLREAMDDDLNTPRAVAALFDLVRAANSWLEETGGSDGDAILEVLDSLHRNAEEVLGLRFGTPAHPDGDLRGLLSVLSRARSALRRNRLFGDADEMRDGLGSLGYRVDDLPDGESRILPS